MTTITRTEAVALLNNLDRGTPACIFTRTEPKMRKTDNPYFGNCQRLARRNVFLGVEYESCARRLQERLDMTPDFEAGPLPWGERDGRYFIAHKGNLYLRFYPVPGTLDEQWQTLDGEAIDKAEVTPFLYGSKDSPIPWRTVKLSNVERLHVNGEQYELTD